MNISFENPDKVNGLLTITVEEDDYKADVEKTLKDYRKKANIPGFRPGQAPMGMIKRQFGMSAKMDAINKLVGNSLYKYVEDNHIKMLGEPLASEKQAPVELEKEAPYRFSFDIAVAPDFNISLTESDVIDYYNITVEDKFVDQQVDMYASRMGKHEEVEVYQDNDMLKGDLRELDENGDTKEGGITVEGAILMPTYIKVEEQKALFEGAKLGDVIAFNPRKAYPDNDTEVAQLLKIERDAVKEMNADFSYQVTEIEHFVKHAVDQELFDSVFGEGVVADEQSFREKIAEGLKGQLVKDSDYKFLLDVRAYCEEKVGDLKYADDLLKRIMLSRNKDKGEDFVEKNYAQSIKELTWSLIKDQLVAAYDIKVESGDIRETAKEVARAQFAQYGMNEVPEEYVDHFADEVMKKQQDSEMLVARTVDRKLTDVLKTVVKLNEKDISVEDFNKMMN